MSWLPLTACSQERTAARGLVLRTEEQLTGQPAVYYHFDELRTGEIYPTILVSGRQIRFRSPGGHVHASVAVPANGVIVPTLSGRYVGVLHLEGSLETPNSEAAQVFEVYDGNGVQMYSLREPVRFDETFGQFYLSDLDGRCVVANPGHGVVKFYDGQGELQRRVDLFTDDQYDLERNLVVALSRDGRRLALAAMKRAPAPAVDGQPRISGDPFLFLFDASGAELFRQSLPGDVVQSVALAPDGGSIAVSTYGVDVVRRRTLLVDSTGHRIGETDLLFRHADYSADGTYLLLAENRRLALLSTATAEMAWSWALDPGEEVIAAVSLAPSGALAAAVLAQSEFEAGTFFMTAAQLMVFGSKGNLLTSRVFPLETFRYVYLKFSSAELAVGFDTGYSIYRIQ